MQGPAYNPNSYFKLFYLAYEGMRPTASRVHQENLIEKIGNGILYIPENLPRQIKRICTNPQAITTAIFVAAHFGNSYLFYPKATVDTVRIVGSYLPGMTEEMLRFIIWLAGSAGITGYCARSGGRLTEGYINLLKQPAVART